MKKLYPIGKRLVTCCPYCGHVCSECNLDGGSCTCCDCPEDYTRDEKGNVVEEDDPQNDERSKTIADSVTEDL